MEPKKKMYIKKKQTSPSERTRTDGVREKRRKDRERKRREDEQGE